MSYGWGALRAAAPSAGTLEILVVDRCGAHIRRVLADRFPEARLAFERADPAARDAVTQFYIAYSFYRQGWGRLYNDDDLFREALKALDRAVAAAPEGRVLVQDEQLGLRSSDALRAELERGLTREWSDLNPLRVLRERQ